MSTRSDPNCNRQPKSKFSFCILFVVAALGIPGRASLLAAEADSVELTPVLLQMVRDTAVQEELDLDSAQIDSVRDLLREVDGPWFRARNMNARQRVATIDKLTNQLRTSLASVLSDKQVDRLSQLERQALGTRMVLRSDIADDLGISTKQQAAFRTMAVETDSDVAKLNKQVFDGELDHKDAGRKIAGLQRAEREQFAKTLTRAQSMKLTELTGASFNFGKVKRMYPLAPELESSGVTWIQGGPLSLEELRGKVVAVHFYAFQCINCKRNLPHYTAWHQDYADKDLVVIGIQTPETSTEKKLDRVASAARSEGIDYPVMLDLERSNWNAWSNTMWPTVYLIDKEGYLRRWWQGEMNWKGTPGEQQMRETVEMLLAE